MSDELKLALSMLASLTGLCLLAAAEWLRYWRVRRRVAAEMGEGFVPANNGSKGWVKR